MRGQEFTLGVVVGVTSGGPVVDRRGYTPNPPEEWVAVIVGWWSDKVARGLFRDPKPPQRG